MITGNKHHLASALEGLAFHLYLTTHKLLSSPLCFPPALVVLAIISDMQRIIGVWFLLDELAYSSCPICEGGTLLHGHQLQPSLLLLLLFYLCCYCFLTAAPATTPTSDKTLDLSGEVIETSMAAISVCMCMCSSSIWV